MVQIVSQKKFMGIVKRNIELWISSNLAELQQFTMEVWIAIINSLLINLFNII